MSKEINVLALIKGEERYIFLYDDNNRTETLRTLGRFAADPQLSFSWYDAAVLSKKLREMAAEEEALVSQPVAANHAQPSTPPRFSFKHEEDKIYVVGVRMQSEIAQFLRYLSVERNASDLTVKSYREDLIDLAEYLIEELGSDVGPDNVSPRDLRGYAAALHEAGYARTSISRKLASLRSFYRFAQQRSLAKSNPAKPLRNPRGQRKLPHFLTNDEVGQLLSAPATRTAMGLRDHAILETMYSAGLRVSEVVGLNDGDLDFEEGIARVRGKGRKERLSPLGSFAIDALNAYLKVRTLSPKEPSGREAPVFVNRFGNRLTTRSVGRMLEKVHRSART